MKYLDILKKGTQKGKKYNYFFFWGHEEKAHNAIDKSCLSQWYDRGFTINSVYYKTAEHYMMAEKARLFDVSMVSKILNAKTPKVAKVLGRKVKNYNNEIWTRNSFNIVVRGNFAKFSQNKDLKDFLLPTSSDILVEASPYDKIWGIGMLGEDKRATNPLLWEGENKLGFALMVVRENLRIKESVHKEIKEGKWLNRYKGDRK